MVLTPPRRITFLALSLSLSAPAFAADATPWYAEAQAYVTENALMTGTEKIGL